MHHFIFFSPPPTNPLFFNFKFTPQLWSLEVWYPHAMLTWTFLSGWDPSPLVCSPAQLWGFSAGGSWTQSGSRRGSALTGRSRPLHLVSVLSAARFCDAAYFILKHYSPLVCESGCGTQEDNVHKVKPLHTGFFNQFKSWQFPFDFHSNEIVIFVQAKSDMKT